MNVTVEYNVPARMRDGAVLRADIYRPAAEGPFPVLLVRTPYGKNVPWLSSQVDPLGSARDGFIIVIQDTRGRFASDGDWEPFTHEADDGHDSVRWAAGLPGSNGCVGMVGSSYLGNTQWMAGLSRPPELRAIAPQVTWSEPDDGLFSRGGAVELGISLPWSLIQGVDAVLRRHAGAPAELGAAMRALVADIDHAADSGYWELPAGRHPAFERNAVPELGFERSRRDPTWSNSCRIAGRQAEAQVPSLNIGGWYDIFSQGTLDNYVASRAAGLPAKLIMGPWTHTDFTGQIGDANLGLAASAELMGFRGRLGDLRRAWLRRHLAPETASSQPDLPAVLLFVMGRNTWREETEWPLTRATSTDVFLRGGSGLTFEPPTATDGGDSYVYDPTDPVPTTGGALLLSSEFRAGPLDQARVEARPDVLVYTSAPLAEDLEVTGRVHAVVHASSEAPSTDWVVRLCDVGPDGVSRNVVDGIKRVTTQPGQIAEHVIDLWSTSYVFRAGHRLRVHVTSSSFPRWDRNLGLGEAPESATACRPARQVIVHDLERPSRLVLPIIP